MRNFCAKCGSPLDNNGKCPKCDVKPSKKELKAEKKSAKKQAKKDKKAQKKAQLTKKQKVKRFFLKFFAVLLALLIAVSGCLCALVYFDVLDIPFVSSALVSFKIKSEETAKNEDNNAEKPTNETVAEEDLDLQENYKVPEFDAEVYFRDNTDLKSSYDVRSSQNISTESEAYDNFEERGFSDSSITSEYSMDGIYSDACEISAYSSSEHPMYKTYFTASNGDIWTIYEIDGSFFAVPISYNFADTTKPQLVISETDTIISYDSTTNKFYVNVPDESVTVIKTVEKIDADTLEKLNSEEIDKL